MLVPTHPGLSIKCTFVFHLRIVADFYFNILVITEDILVEMNKTLQITFAAQLCDYLE